MSSSSAAMLEKEFNYYKEHQSELVDKHHGKVVVIVGDKVVGVFDDEQSAYLDSAKKFELGTFLIQRCLPGEESYTQTFHSRAYFD